MNKLLTTPSEALVADMAKIDGDIVILGAGGKMGPSLSVLIKNACEAAGSDKKVTAVSRFTDPYAVALLEDSGVRVHRAELLDPAALERLPDAENVIFMAGRKFGTGGQEALTWAMNAWLPSLVAERYKHARIVAFSSGNVYPMLDPAEGGAHEDTPPEPVGEYAMSCLARERIFEYASLNYGTPVCLYRLNYSVDLRYGVLYDLAARIADSRPVRITTPYVNCIWQGSANEAAARCLLLCDSPAARIKLCDVE